MTWEIAAAWAGVVVSAVIGFVANHQSAGAKKTAAEALAASQSMAASLDKIAQELAQPRRVSPQAGTAAAPEPGPAAAPEPGPAWNIEYRGGQTYALRNVGSGPATRVTITTPPGVARQLPTGDGVDLEPAQAHGFVMTATRQSPLPTDVLVSCAERGDERVPLPSRPS